MTVSEYVMKFLVDKGICDVFMVSGGAIVHLMDALGRNKDLNYFCNYHEQTSAICAEGYARVAKRPGVCLVTLGPGAVNALSGIMGAWVDSIPVLVISGQVRSDLIADFNHLRQFGPQEANLMPMIKPVTKYCVSIRQPERIRFELEKAYHIATTDRPGPVWIEIPLDVQGAQIDAATLQGYAPEPTILPSKQELARQVAIVTEKIRQSKRPIFIAGNGVHLSNAENLLSDLLELVKIPIVLPQTAKDLIKENHPLNIGIIGTTGQRRANFAVQNSDLLISLGTGLSCNKVGFNFDGFAPKAEKIVVDIDDGQLFHQAIRPDIAVKSDVGAFIKELTSQCKLINYSPQPLWIEACVRWKERYPIVPETCDQDTGFINSYIFMDRLSKFLSHTDILVTGNGMDVVSFYQSFSVKKGQRTIINGNWGAMGWDLSAAIGACIGGNKRRTVCVTGDGSIQMNVHELLAITYYKLPITIFVFNNHGYSCIRFTQENLCNGLLVGADASCGVANPNFELLANAFGLKYGAIKSCMDIDEVMGYILNINAPALVEVSISKTQKLAPKAAAYRREDGSFASRPLEDMEPLLPREEIWENMHLFNE
jgi:acetolactate synthase I/II/III large subunit